MNIKKLSEQYKKDGYVLIKGFYDKQFCNILNTYCAYRYLNLKDFMESDNIQYRETTDGTLEDEQTPGAASFYGDPFMEAMLYNNTEFVKQVTKHDVRPTYSYWRYYRKGNQLKPHTDRRDCKVSTTICAGYDYGDLKDYNWSIYMKNKKINCLDMHPGDMVIYNGIDLLHWRDKFKGNYQSQIFNHYSDLPVFKHLNDERPRLGLPDVFRTF